MTDPATGMPAHAIAIVGFAGRFPGAVDAPQLFAHLCAGREGVTFFADGDLDPSVSAADRADPRYVKARGLLPQWDRFDHEFFGMLPLEAAVMDPQQRVLLELAWAALESCGHRAADFARGVGVFVGAQWSQYGRHVVATRPDVLASFGEGNATIANEQDFVATRISYELGLRGPSLSLATACSTSLVAVARAARSLQDGECDLALAGGASIAVPVLAGYRHEPGGMLSADGHCRPFDAAASGTTFGDGAAIVVLRRLRDALADGDPIHAVLLGHATNNDGDDKVSFTAPSVAGQAAVLRAALAHAGVDPATVGYVETHGTATPMGDPIEFAALVRAYRGADAALPPCALGAVKSSVGHLVHAAGVTGLLTAMFAVRDAVLPPVLHFAAPNPRLQLERTRFRVHRQPCPWPGQSGPRRAAVSSFGVGGTNAHVVLQQPPERGPTAAASGPQWLRLSARSAAALQRRIDDLRAFLRRDGERHALADIAFTLAAGREVMSRRAAVRVADSTDAIAALGDTRRLRRGVADGERRVVFQFPGHGVQRVGMARRLYDALPECRASLETGIAFVLQHGGPDLRPLLLGGGSDALLDDPQVAHPALFLCEHALALGLQAAGLRADAVLGCSLGEFAAATLAGVMTFEDALAVVTSSGRALREAPPGAMLTVYCGADEVVAHLPAGVTVAAVYAPDAVVVAGEVASILAVGQRLREAGVRTAPLRADHAFHTPALAAVGRRLQEELATKGLRAPRCAFYSAAAGGELSAAQAVSPSHWASILTGPVRHADALQQAIAAEDSVFVEVGPGVTLTALALLRTGPGGARPVAAMPGSGLDETTVPDLFAAVAHCWANGVESAAAVAAPASPRRVVLPTYPFERTRHWLEPGARMIPADVDDDVADVHEAVGAVPSPAARLARVLAGACGQEVDLASDADWTELGFDSLITTQVAIGVRREFEVELGFRDLVERHPSARALLTWLESEVAARPQPPAVAATPGPAPERAAAAASASPAVQRPNAGARIERKATDRHRTDERQQRFLQRFFADYAARTARSKQFAQQHRDCLADPRVVTGFHPVWKEIVYPIVTERSRGSRLWDLDGNEYVDLLNGFGSILFGHSPDFLTQAVQAQLERGIEIGPQTPLAGEVARLFCELTANERVSFTNTGSEAVTAALRLARTVTGREKFVMFEGSYHGIFDEVLARPGPGGVATPASPGVPRSHVGEMIVLPYGEASSLDEIERLAGGLAGVLVEPVQGRHPDLQPREFLVRLREITRRAGCALVFDEVVTGFRSHLGGIQALFGIDADIALYGKVVAGGHPIGIVAGKARFLDALDGGQWRFGDDSVPETGVTFFAGTFVRHPVALAAARATLLRLRDLGPALQEELATRTATLVAQLNACFDAAHVEIRVERFRSAFFWSVKSTEPWSSVLFAMLRHRGIHIWEQFPCFLTTSHTEADVARVVQCTREAVTALRDVGLLGRRTGAPATSAAPVPGARLGRRADGTPAWFVPDPNTKGGYRDLGDARST